jgi:hypothetical protein
MTRGRLIQTSRGWTAFWLLEQRWTGFSVSVDCFGADGWEAGPEERQKWFARESDETLEQFLVSSVRLSPSEARDLASQLQGPWRDEWLERGGKPDMRLLGRALLWTFIGLGLVALLTLMGIAFVIWLVAT